MLDWVRSERAVALVMHESYIMHVASLQCDLVAVGMPFHATDTGIAMPLRAPRDLMHEVDAAIAALASDGTLERMKEDLVTEAGGTCRTPTVKKAKAISFGQVAGLWCVARRKGL